MTLRRLLCLVLFLAASWSFCAESEKQDYRGLFGSYRRDKFTENPGNNSDIGMNFMLSTLFPVTAMVKSQTSSGGAADTLHYAAFFDAEIEGFFTLNYSWEIFLRIGFFKYETRKENSTTPTQPLFHEFEFEMVPALAGVRYRFSRGDVVPYIGLAGGMSHVTRRAGYDYNPARNREESTVATGEIIGGLEFYFGPSAGIRVEAGVMHVRAKEFTFDEPPAGPGASNLPVFIYQANPFMVRYASGLFIVF